MIYTLTLNPAVDKTVTIPGFTPGAVNRIISLRRDVGGKGINVSKCLQKLGTASAAAGFFGGDEGDRAAQELENSGIETIPVLIPGKIRTNLKIVDPDRGEVTDINEPGPEVDPVDWSVLEHKLSTRLKAGDLLILSGSLPRGMEPETYRDLAEKYAARGVDVMLDCDGRSLKLGLEGKPMLVKPNVQERSGAVGRPLSTRQQIREAARELIGRGVGSVLVSMGRGGAMLVTPGGIWEADGVIVSMGSTVGAGDAMVAAMAIARERKLEPKKALALAVAAATASVMCSGTQPPEAQTVKNLYIQVKVVQIQQQEPK